MSDIKNLVHIGFSKTGSSFLKYWYDAHPQLHYTNMQTLGGFKDTTAIYDYTKCDKLDNIKYFVTSDTRMHCWRIQDVDCADDWFDVKDTVEHQKKVGQIAKGLFGNARVLIITRGFEGMLKSFYSSYVKRGGVMSIEGMLEEYFKDYILPAYDYDTIIRLYIENFGKDNVVLLPYEMLSENVELFLREISDCLGVKHIEFTPNPVNVSFSQAEIYWYRRMSGLLKNILKPIGKKYSTKIFNKYVHYLSQNKFHLVANILGRIKRKSESLKVPEIFLKSFHGKAEVLKQYPHYSVYCKEYYID